MTMTSLKTLASALPSFLSGAVTAGVLYAANRLHVPVLDTDVEAIVTPFISSGVTAAFHVLRSPKVKAEAEKVEKDPVVEFVSREITSRLLASPKLKDRLVAAAVSELHVIEAQSALVKAAAVDAPKVEAAIKAVEEAQNPLLVGAVPLSPLPHDAPAPVLPDAPAREIVATGNEAPQT